ncbi:hypothetical protein J421_4160 [Gemmatirosa kalamazoonensis]|uniref:Uncharacterized protein n=1 Tax=Gemmatirosa kalamazoonensis TaxID=861299 RepID=W0RMM0_9BACT|nr:hypothetical protein [Gemmatirosa kalamazoonensis]AHG91697.1 hypothetical protein J421_4160 [Gemmatirosa kalamazoonensis]
MRLRPTTGRPLAALSLALVLAAACGGDGSPAPVEPPPPLAVTLPSTTLACTVGDSLTITAAVSGATGTPSVSYAATGASVSVTRSGTEARVRCVAPGTATLTATALDGSRSATANVTINVVAPLTVTLAPGTLTCRAGETRTVSLVATGGPPAPNVTLVSSSETVAVAGVSGETATIRCVSAGASVLTATATIGTQIARATAIVTVAVPPPPPLVATPSAAALSCRTGERLTLTLNVSGGVGTPAVFFAARNALVRVLPNGTTATILCDDAGASAVDFTVSDGTSSVTGAVPITVSAALSASIDAPVCWLGGRGTLTVNAVGGTGPISVTLTSTGTPAFDPSAVVQTATGATLTYDCGTVAATGAVGYLVRRGTESVSGSVPVTLRSPIQSVRVLTAPSVTILAGSSANVIGDVVLVPGAPTTTSRALTYTTTDPTLLTIEPAAQGVLVTPKRSSGAAAITITSVAAPAFFVTVPVTVVSAPSITVQSVDVVSGGVHTGPVNPSNVTGTISPNLTVDVGAFIVDRVVISLGTLQVNMDFRSQPDAARTGSLALSPAFDTAARDPSSGQPLMPNGTYLLAVTAFYHAAGSSTTQSVSTTYSVPFVIANP